MVKCNGHVKAMPIAAHNQLEVMHAIQAHTREGSRLLTILSTTEINPILVRKASDYPRSSTGSVVPRTSTGNRSEAA